MCAFASVQASTRRSAAALSRNNAPVDVSGRHVVTTALCTELGGLLARPCYWLAASPRSTYAVLSAYSVHISCRVREISANSQSRKSSEDFSVTVSGITDRGSFD